MERYAKLKKKINYLIIVKNEMEFCNSNNLTNKTKIDEKGNSENKVVSFEKKTTFKIKSDSSNNAPIKIIDKTEIN
ncbi:MAG: hypothetical protein FWH24_02305 [Oscillospiraceae bacterium]|nr:hypothetical protein [Oscillospiraceae bacterium]